MKPVLLGRSIPGHSRLHRGDARAKFIAAVAMMVATLACRDLYVLLAIAVWTLTLALISRVKPRLILRSIRPILWIIVLAVIVHMFTVDGTVWVRLGDLTVTREGVLSGAFFAARLILLVIGTQLLLTMTTPPLALADAIERLLSPLRHVKFPVEAFAMMMSIAIRFIPTLIDESQKIMKAQSSRGADFDTGGPFRRMRGLVSIFVPLFISGFRRADDLAIAMEARCYQGEGRTRLYTLRMDAWDVCLMIVTVGLAVVATVFKN